MDKAKYLSIRKQIGFKIKSYELYRHLFEDAIIACIGFFLATNICSKSSAWTYLLISPFIAITMYRKFGLFHDAVHGAISKNKSINNLVGVLSGTFCLLPFEPWRINHLQHHSWSGNIEKDPVMAILIVYPKLNNSVKNVFRFGWRTGLPILALAQHFVFWILSVKVVLLRKDWSAKLVASIVVPTLIWGLLLATLPFQFFIFAVIPGLFLYLIGVEAINLPHHLQLPYHGGETKFHFWEQFKTARTCIYPRWIAQFIVLNFNYHIEHHLYPDAPWYYLKQIHQSIRPLLQGSYNLDSQFRWIIKAKQQSLDQVLFETQASEAEAKSA